MFGTYINSVLIICSLFHLFQGTNIWLLFNMGNQIYRQILKITILYIIQSCVCACVCVIVSHWNIHTGHDLKTFFRIKFFYKLENEF